MRDGRMNSRKPITSNLSRVPANWRRQFKTIFETMPERSMAHNTVRMAFFKFGGLSVHAHRRP